MTESKLSQIVAIAKGEKSRYTEFLTSLHRQHGQTNMFNGFRRKYTPKDEGGDTLPEEYTRVQSRVEDNLGELKSELAKVIDIEATRDHGNTVASADVTVDGVTLMKDAPPTLLLAMEQQMKGIIEFIKNIPVLSESEEWNRDEQSRLWRTDPVKVNKTSKEQVPIVKYDATEKHPAQTEIITKDVTVGTWEKTGLSGAMPQAEQRRLRNKAIKLQNAIKEAREEANSARIERQAIGEGISDYLFG